MRFPFSFSGRRRQLERSCAWSRERLKAHQRRAIARLRAFAYARSPFYRRFHDGLAERPFDEVPILTKATLMENFDQLVTDRSLRLADLDLFLRDADADALFRKRYVVLATSGSTGLRGISPSLHSHTRAGPNGQSGADTTKRLAVPAPTARSARSRRRGH